MLIGESNVAIDPAIGGYGVADIYLGEFSSQAQRNEVYTPFTHSTGIARGVTYAKLTHTVAGPGGRPGYTTAPHSGLFLAGFPILVNFNYALNTRIEQVQ